MGLTLVLFVYLTNGLEYTQETYIDYGFLVWKHYVRKIALKLELEL